MSVFTTMPAEDRVELGEFWWGVFDNYPVTFGHVLFVLRREAPDFSDLLPAEWSELRAHINHMSRVFREHAGCKVDFNIGINDGLLAGRTVNHLHVHLIPRYPGDMEDPRGGVRHVIPERGNYKLPGFNPKAAPRPKAD